MARSLAQANVRKAINTALGNDPDPAALPPGHMRLYRHYKPSLQPGLYGVEAKQTITSVVEGQTSNITVFNYETAQATNLNVAGGPENPNAPTLLQQFEVVAPQFQIDPKIINSVYPPPGHTDEGIVLPHIVFNDPHIPWDRTIPLQTAQSATVSTAPRNPISELLHQQTTQSIKSSSAEKQANPKTDAVLFNPYIPPWMGLVVFDVDELKLSPAEETSLGISTPSNPPPPSTGKVQQVGPSPGQVATPGAYSMTVGDYLTKITSRVQYELGFTDPDQQPALQALMKSADPTSIIFPQKTLVNTIFNPTLQFVVLSHVRHVNTVGFPDAGIEEEGLYSVCISKRTGPTSYPTANPNPVPVTQVAHLVSLEHLQESMGGRALFPSDRIGLVSLYSWTYLSVPPQPVNFKDTMTNLAKKLQTLRPLEHVLQSISDSIATQTTPALKAAAQLLYDRLSLGYTMSRWRTAVGQETVAFNRGPCVPSMTPWKPSVAADWPGSSNTGKDYQILDKDLGVMDVSYSSAWQLGKLMAISDNIFNSALLRFRSLIHEGAASDTRKQINSIASRSVVVRSATKAVEELHGAINEARSPARLILPSRDKAGPVLSSPEVATIFRNHLIRVIDAQTAAGQAIYSDYTLGNANNSDWAIIHKWISDKLFLGGIPAHYLFPDPSLLPSEALRFFYIDDTWMDCFLDGALSVANHLEPVDDKVRRRIKDVYNVFLRNNIEPATIKPPVPRYGFVLRSAIIKIMPDIRITVTCRTGTAPNYQPDSTRAPLVRLTKLDDYTILGLVDCLPEEIYEIVFAQPPHQQRFVAAAQLDPTPIYNVRQLYTSNAPEGTGDAGVWPPIDPTKAPTADQMAKWYDKGSRCVNALQMAVDINKALNTTTNYSSAVDSVMLALELNDSSYQLQILPPPSSDPSTAPPFTRQLWVGVDVDDPEDPIPVAKPVIQIVPGPIFPPRIPPSTALRAAPPTTSKKPQQTTGSSKAKNPKISASSQNMKPTASSSNSPKSPKSPTTTRTPKSPTSPRVSKSLTSTQRPSSDSGHQGDRPHHASALITTHSPSNPQVTAHRAIPLNFSRPSIIPLHLQNDASPPTATTATILPQYALSVHPDYHGAPPLPFVSPSGAKTFSAHDYIPTATVHLFDLIFSLQIPPPSTTTTSSSTIPITTSNPLVSLSIFIPASTSSDDPTTITAEPLLTAPYLGGGANMIHNKRLLPAISTNSGHLIITLTPRSPLPNTTVPPPSLSIASVSDASFRLAAAYIAPIITPSAVTILGPGDSQRRALCSVRVTETYLLADGTQGTASSSWDVVKRDGGDVDLAGNEV